MRRRVRFGGWGRPLAMAFGVQGLLLASAGFVAVFGPARREKPEFVAEKTVYLPQREIEHRMAVAELQSASASPMQIERLSTAALIPTVMPKLPDLASIEFSPLDREDAFLDAEGLLGRSGLFGLTAGIGGDGSRLAFLGIEDQTRSVVILFDVSLSVKNKVESSGLSMEAIRDEAGRLVDQLGANTLFGLVQFTRRYDMFRQYLVPATIENRAAALEWLQTEFRTQGHAPRGWVNGSPNGIQLVLDAAFAFEPDVIILLSDGNFYRDLPGRSFGQMTPYAEIIRTARALQEDRETPARIHFVGFQVREADRDGIQRLIKPYGGAFRDHQ